MEHIAGIPKLFVVEYSMTQSATYAHTLQAMAMNNRELIMKGQRHDYVPIGIFPTRAEADKFRVAFQPTLDEQAKLPIPDRDWQHISEVLDTLLPKDLNPKI